MVLIRQVVPIRNGFVETFEENSVLPSAEFINHFFAETATRIGIRRLLTRQLSRPMGAVMMALAMGMEMGMGMVTGMVVGMVVGMADMTFLASASVIQRKTAKTVIVNVFML